ncbi:putative Gamma-interferon-inducible lysosomal thiol reductase [Quillaja saponaria]|uniref:Gamma-interferon-inducible lysosomal thiol reductase n=1 Tax=Quillaja saponaria TaxID=32244 RepID=A0AAD7LQL4_QUISA|nr:putative Gamma-interferon-inducible lysosomal thiol reductase [Quillaja saponaria]
MVSPRLAITIAMAFVPFLFIFESHASSGSEDFGVEVSPVDSDQKVNLSVYYDSLCPSCSTFIVKNLVQVFDKGLIKIVNLRLIPWGNAYINRTNNAFVCQKGPDECQLNTLAACAINNWPDVNMHYALIYCFEFLTIEGRQKSWQSCFSSLGLLKKPILDCYNSGYGTLLDQKYANETLHLYPAHSFVPWVLVNKQPIGKDYENFVSRVCKAYKGNAVPAACD